MRTEIIQTDKYIVRVHHPDLTPEEYETRRERLRAAAAKVLLSAELRKLGRKV